MSFWIILLNSIWNRHNIEKRINFRNIKWSGLFVINFFFFHAYMTEVKLRVLQNPDYKLNIGATVPCLENNESTCLPW